MSAMKRLFQLMAEKTTYTPRLKTRYESEIRPSLVERFEHSSPMQAAKIGQQRDKSGKIKRAGRQATLTRPASPRSRCSCSTITRPTKRSFTRDLPPAYFNLNHAACATCCAATASCWRGSMPLRTIST